MMLPYNFPYIIIVQVIVYFWVHWAHPSYFENRIPLKPALGGVCKKGKRKVQGVPQSQTAALPRPQEEEETDKSKQAQTGQTYEKH